MMMMIIYDHVCMVERKYIKVGRLGRLNSLTLRKIGILFYFIFGLFNFCYWYMLIYLRNWVRGWRIDLCRA